MIRKLENLEVHGSTEGLVFPMGCSFNNAAPIYMTLAVFFLAQASNVHFTLGQDVSSCCLRWWHPRAAPACRVAPS